MLRGGRWWGTPNTKHQTPQQRVSAKNTHHAVQAEGKVCCRLAQAKLPPPPPSQHAIPRHNTPNKDSLSVSIIHPTTHTHTHPRTRNRGAVVGAVVAKDAAAQPAVVPPHKHPKLDVAARAAGSFFVRDPHRGCSGGDDGSSGLRSVLCAAGGAPGASGLLGNGRRLPAITATVQFHLPKEVYGCCVRVHGRLCVFKSLLGEENGENVPWKVEEIAATVQTGCTWRNVKTTYGLCFLGSTVAARVPGCTA